MGEVSTWGAIASVAGGVTLAGVLDYFHLWYEVTSIFAALLILDFIFWIADAYLEDKQKITSTRMWRGLAKKLCKLMLPLIVVLVLRGVGFENLDMVVTTIMSILVITEWYSIIWHIFSISAWKTIPEIDAFSLLLDFIVNIFKQKLPKTESLEMKEEKGED